MVTKKDTLTNLPPKHRKPKKPNRIRPRDNRRGEVHLICDGEAKVFRTKPSGDVWQFEMKIKGERYDTSKKTFIAADLYISQYDDFFSPATIITPLVKRIEDDAVVWYLNHTKTTFS